jgi:FAD/FMN-containing dehydrogenase/Fe-S oxidoreductase
MIPRLAPRSGQADINTAFLAELRLRGFEGETTINESDRIVYGTDNSIYQVSPAAIVFPRNQTDVIRLAKLANESHFQSITLTPRGGGTGTNGQSLARGVLVDLSRHMNHILEVNIEERWVRVQAGVVKDQLNEAVKQHGLFFAPELSPSNRATIGGMISTDASGQGSILYGKTSNHVLELQLVLMDGTSWHSLPLAPSSLEKVKQRQDRVGTIHRLLDCIYTEDASLIAEKFPKLNRCVTGYDLAHLYDCHGNFNLSSVLCGAEGSLAFVTEAKVNLLPIPKHSALLNIRYGTFDAALRDARNLMLFEAASSETVDAKVLELARDDAVWLTVKDYFPDDPEGPAQGINIVEFLASSDAELDCKLARVEEALSSTHRSAGRRGYTVARGQKACQTIWSMRKKSVGLLGNMKGERRPMPFVEDTVVPPERLADYIAEFREVLDRRGLVYGMFGHVDAGCLHVRPALDMKDPEQEVLVREISDEIFQLTRRYQGVLWGEHGKGFRSEYAPEFFGALYPKLQEIKAAFDPGDQLNPGKIASPPGRALTRLDAVPIRGQFDRQIPIAVRRANEDSLHCNGNAACFNFDPDDAMCPSWKATRDRQHSPKGRASLMREWLRQLAELRVDPNEIALRLRRRSVFRRVTDWFSRAKNTLTNGESSGDFSNEVRQAMDGCLACKSCVGQCPIKVDVPAFRSRFLEAYYGRYLRPLKHGMAASLERGLPIAAMWPGAVNRLMSSSLGKLIVERFGLVEPPALSGICLVSELRKRGINRATADALGALTPERRAVSVIIVQDAFTTYYDTRVVLDIFELLRQLGFEPWIAPYMANGKPEHVLGFLERFERTASKNCAMLAQLAKTGVALVGVDPSMTLAYRAEYVKTLGDAHVPKVALLQEWLVQQLEALPTLARDRSPPWALLAHCTEKTNVPSGGNDWATIFEHFGMSLTMPPTGCCGMAGLFGHEREHRQTSVAIFELSWARQLADPRHGGHVLATGYSCRCQVSLLRGKNLLHPAQALLHRIQANRRLKHHA